MKLEYGSKEQTKILDEHGSTVMVETKFRAGIMTTPTRMRYNIKIKVMDRAQELEEYAKFSDELKQHSGWFDPYWQWQKHASGMFIIKSYTVVES